MTGTTQKSNQDRLDVKRIVVLISGNGSNLQALIDQVHQTDESAEIVAVFSNVVDAFGLQRAKDARIDTHSFSHKIFASRAEFDNELCKKIEQYQADLVILAGFMRILTPAFVNRFLGRMINIHPSLLPDFQGLNTHQRVLDEKVKIHGASVHFVTEELDGGPSVLQATVPVITDDKVDSLASRVLVQEHLIYPQVVKWFCAGRLQLKNGVAFLDGIALAPGGVRIDNVSTHSKVVTSKT